MPQSRLASLAEAIVNTAIGFIISLCINYIVFPAYDIHVSLWSNIQIVFWFTLASVVRSYYIRRMWNAEWWRLLFKKG